MGMLTGILISIGFFAAIVVMVYFGVKGWIKRNQMEHEERMLAIEKGAEIPMAPTRVKNPYVWPLVLIALGIAMIIGMALSGDADQDWAWGFLPMLIGVGMLIARSIFRKQQKKEEEISPEAPSIEAGREVPPEAPSIEAGSKEAPKP